jgi:hypothetical protein
MLNNPIDLQLETNCKLMYNIKAVWEIDPKKRIIEIQDENELDLTGQNQHGFKRGKSTATLSIDLQSCITRALDNDECVMVSSLNLSAAFDIVNIDLLIKRLKMVYQVLY